MATTLKRDRSDTPGFTLVEIVVAAAVFAIAMVTAIGALAQVMNHQRVVELRATATDFNMSMLELVQRATLLRDQAEELITNAESIVTVNGDGVTPLVIPGLPGARVTIQAVNDGGDVVDLNDPDDPSNDVVDSLEDFLDDDTTNADGTYANMPDPLEVRVRIVVPIDPSNPNAYETTYITATFVDVL